MSRILILTPQLPYPPYQGASLRNFHIIQGLAERHEVTLLSFLEDNQSEDPAVIGPLLQRCRAVKTIPILRRNPSTRLRHLLASRLPDMAHRLHSPAFDAALHRLLTANRFDVVQIEGIELARAITIVRQVSPKSKIVFDDHNAETELQRRAFLTDLPTPRRWLAAVYSFFQIGRLRRFESWACRQADAVTAVSDADRHHLRTLVAGLPVTVIPNCIDILKVQAAQHMEMPDGFAYDLLFSGKMDYRPNIDAVLWFAQEIWPLIIERRSQTTWAIVGQKPHARLSAVGRLPGITITGWVESVMPFLVGCNICLMPFRLGSGTRLKLLEAMAAGRAIVTTPSGAEGFAVRDGQELLVVQEATEMATAVLRLLDDPVERARLGVAAQAFAQQYDWRQVIPAFEGVYAA